jgi:hypothetical protein
VFVQFFNQEAGKPRAEFGGRFHFKFRQATAAPGTELRVVRAHLEARPQVIGAEDVIVIHENQEVAFGFGDAAQARRREADFVLANMAGVGMPGKVETFG